MVVLLDLWTKSWAIRTLSRQGSIEILGDFVRFSYVRNPGVAFGLFADRGVPLGWVSVVALVLVLVLAFRPTARAWSRALSLGLILGGAIGNLVDRVRWGSVIDFIDVGIGATRWPVFNVADSAISIGVALWAVQLLLPHHQKEHPDSAVLAHSQDAMPASAEPQAAQRSTASQADNARGA